jgi:DNA-binding GntR family transcriptional regulator
MSPPSTFERVYAAIKDQLRSGIFRPGERLEPAALGDQLNASVTPVRDALHRLTGERLVETPRHEGFRVPLVTETTLRHLYAWHLDLLLLAVINRRAMTAADPAVVTEAEPGSSRHGRQNDLFLALARSTGNPEHLAALEALRQRLEPVQRWEETFLDQTDAETVSIVQAVQAGDRKALRRALVRYHRRRQKIIPELLTRMLQG